MRKRSATISRLQSILTHPWFIRLFLLAVLVPFWIFLRSVYRDRIGAFGCFDDCNNFVGGYFLLAGKRLYSEIAFNHQPLMAYISYFIQRFLPTDTLYILVYNHRMLITYVSLIADVFLTLRFALVGAGFAFLYESTKGYVFGERFLAESLIVYPLVYLFGLVWHTLKKKHVYAVELVIASFCTWFVVFMREPYIPLVLFLYGALLFLHRHRRLVWVSVFIFLLATTTIILYHSVPDYVYNIFTNNTDYVKIEVEGTNKIFGTGFFRVAFYPLFLFAGGIWNFFRTIEAALAALLLFLIVSLWKQKKERQIIFFVFTTLALANIRPPWITGEIYYGAFHHIQWYALFVASVLFFIRDMWDAKKKIRTLLASLIAGSIIGVALVSPQSYLHEHVDRATEFTTNYATYAVTGDTVRLLSRENDTLFSDGAGDELIYWQSKRISSYAYAWYTNVMPSFDRYRQARDEMYASRPPTFLYGTCTENTFVPIGIPLGRASEYTRLRRASGSTCLFIRKEKISSITDDQWESVKKYDIQKPTLEEYQ